MILSPVAPAEDAGPNVASQARKLIRQESCMVTLATAYGQPLSSANKRKVES